MFILNNKTNEKKEKTCINTYIHFNFTTHYSCFRVFLLCLLCLQSNGAVIGDGCTEDVDCNYNNGKSVDLFCGCVATHYVQGTECTPSNFISIN